MTDIVFSFDTEDYVHKCGADAILRCTELLEKHGVVGCFNVVARLAMALEQWGRDDVIEALKKHQITTHSYDHSHHPTICEYTDLEDYDAALKEFWDEINYKGVNTEPKDWKESPHHTPEGVERFYENFDYLL